MQHVTTNKAAVLQESCACGVEWTQFHPLVIVFMLSCLYICVVPGALQTYRIPVV